MKVRKMNVENGKVVLDPNNWLDIRWYEEDSEIYEYMLMNKEYILKYAEEMNYSIKMAIEIMFQRDGLTQEDSDKE